MPAEIPACPFPLVDLLAALGILRREAQDKSILDEIITWLVSRLNVLVGLSVKESWATVHRLAEGRNLDEPANYAEAYVGLESNLNHVAVPLHDLDRDGTTNRLWRHLYRRWPIIRDLHAELVNSVPRSAGLSNGPHPPNQFVWNGETYDLAPIPWRLLIALWKHERRAVESVVSEVWGHDCDVSQAAIKSALTRLNQVLVDAGAPMSWGLRAGHFMKR